MSPLEIALVSVLGTIAIVGVTIGLWVLSLRRKTQRQLERSTVVEMIAAARMLTESMKQHSASMDQYLVAVKETKEPLKDVPKLMAGWVKLSGESVLQIEALRREVKLMRESIFRKDEIRAVENPTEEQAGLSWEIQRILAENPQLSHAEALERAIGDIGRRVVGDNQFELA